MVIVTGAAGFIGSCMITWLNQNGMNNLVLVDDFSFMEKIDNLKNKKYLLKIERLKFFDWLEKNGNEVKFIYHLGARTDTTEFNKSVLDELNLNYTKKIWNYCINFNIPLVYASSAATYGDGSLGYSDNHDLPAKLKPLNPYGISKNDFDVWALQQKIQPPIWKGIKFFNVFGPNEYHKGRMASVVFHSYKQIRENNKVQLFKSHHPDFRDGEQLRDFIYVKDVIKVLHFFQTNQTPNGIYNLGTGKARSFIDLVNAVFCALEIKSRIEFIDTPTDIRDKYQYYTQAEMQKLRNAGYTLPFANLEDAVKDYVTNYLESNKCY